MFRSPVRIGMLVAGGVLTGGCMFGGSEGSVEGDLESLQARVVERTQDAVDALGSAGLDVEEAAGVAEYCGLQPGPGVTYRTGARLPESDDPAARVAVVRDVLVELGWEVADEGTTPEPFATLAMDDLRASVGVSKRQDRPGVTFGVTGPCLEVEDTNHLDGDDRRVELETGG